MPTAMVTAMATTRSEALCGPVAQTLIVATAIALAALCVSVGTAAVTRVDHPDVAATLWPHDAVANAMIADIALQFGGPTKLGEAEARARTSLHFQALNPQALRVLGFVRDARGDENGAAALVKAAGRQSRRDLGTQLWLINDAVTRDDAGRALALYDQTMRALPESRPILFPILANVLNDREYAPLIDRVMATHPNWRLPFAEYLVSTGTALEPLAGLVSKMALAEGERTRIVVQLFDQMARQNRYPAAVALYRTLPDRPDLTRGLPDGFTNWGVYEPFDWQIALPESMRAEFDEQHRLVVSEVATGGSPAALRALALSPGLYRLVTDGSGGIGLDWTLTCASPGRLLVTLSVPATPQEEHAEARFEVPGQACAGQFLRLTPKQSSLDREVSRIRSVAIVAQ